MRLEQIVLENFGCYTRQEFSFGQHPLVLLYGANESGKTTALNGLRQAIFGFRTRTPYLTGATMSAAVIAHLQSGQRLQFQRRKGRPDSVSGLLDDKKLEAAHLQELLGRVDLDSYEHLFGFSQEELRLGQETLKSARLTEALAGGSLGGMHTLEQLRTELAGSLQDLYKPRGSTSLINVRLQRLSELKQQLKEQELLPAEIEQLRRQIRQAEATGDALRDEYEALLRSQQERKRLQAALPHYAAMKVTQLQLNQLKIPEELDATFLAEWSEVIEQRRALKDSLEQAQQQLQEQCAELESLPGDGNCSDFEDEIEAVGHQASEIPQLRQRLAGLAEQMESRQAACDKLLKLFDLEALPAAWGSFRISLPQRRKLEAWGEQYGSATNRLVAIRAKLETAETTLSTERAASADDLFPENLGELTALVAKLEAAETEVATQARSLEKAMHDTSFVQLCSRLEQHLSDRDCVLDSAWPVPEPQQVVLCRRLVESAEAHMEQSRQAVEEASAALGKLEAGQDVASGQATAALLKQLNELRRQREAITSQWLDELSQPLLAASVSVEQQQERLQELQRVAHAVDGLQSQLFESAEALAEQRHHQLRVQQLRERQQVALRRQSECVERQRQARAEWQTLWASVPVRAGNCDQLQAWSEDFQQWRSASANMRAARRELHIARGITRTLRDQLLDLWPTLLRPETEVSTLQQQLRDWDAAKRQRSQQTQRLRAAEETVRSLLAKCREYEDQQRSAEAAFAAWLQTTPLMEASVVAHWPLAEVATLLDSLERLVAEDVALGQMRQDWQRQEAQRIAFAERIESLQLRMKASGTSLASPTPSPSPQAQPTSRAADAPCEIFPEQRARGWFTQLKELRSEQARRIQLTASVEHQRQRVKEIQERVQQLDEKLAAVAAATGALSVTELQTLIDRAREAETLRQNLGQLQATLLASCPEGQLEAFCDQLSELDEARLTLELKEDASRLAEIEQRRRVADQQIGSLQERITQLAGNQQAQATRQLLQHERGELAELAEQWAVQRLANELLSRSIVKFAEENEPALIRHTRQYLTQLTGGRYIDVEHDQAGKEQFLVRNASGEAFPPSRLSTGTREQLYLAIRLAFIEHHCQQHEPLPVVMDDCFVNFDDQRTKLALQAIANQDTAQQTILLSCHSRVPQLLAEIAPTARVIDLEHQRTTTADEFAAQAIIG